MNVNEVPVSEIDSKTCCIGTSLKSVNMYIESDVHVYTLPLHYAQLLTLS